MARLGIKARLGLVALAPALAVAAGAGSIALDKAGFSRDVDELRVAVRRLDADVRLRAALHGEQAMAQLVVRLPGFGVSPKMAGGFLGRDLDADVATRRAEVDRILAEATPAVRADITPLLAQARAALASAGGDPVQVAVPYNAAAERAADAAAVDLADVRLRAGELSGTGRIVQMVDATRRASGLSQEGVQQAGELADVVFSPAPERTARLVRLAATHARFDSAANALREVEGPAAALAALEADPEVADYLAQLEAIAVDGDVTAIPGTMDLAGLSAMFRGVLDYQDMAPSVVAGATDSLLAAADDTADQATAAFRTALLVLTSVLLGTMLIAAANAVTLARSLRRLADDVRAVQSGDLDHIVASGSGTTEIGVLQHAVGDLVANLRTVDRQAQALAVGDLDAAVLDEQVPGNLGLALRGSVDRLSAVMAEERALRDRLAHAATHDSLTGLVNRLGVLGHIDRELASAARGGRTTALVFIDLDEFKRVNDVHGHAAGDHVLRQVAERLHAAARAGDVMARLGGDEFLAVLPDVDGAAAAVTMAERLLHATREPIVVEGERYVVSASIGVALARDGQTDGSELLEQADVAVFRAKTRGRGRVEVFDTELQLQLEEHASIERALADALVAGELVVHYQPIIDHRDLAPVGVEALVRWERPGHGLVPPGVFIPVAEASDLITDVGRYVLRVATAQLAAGVGGPFAGLEVAVNVSARHVTSGSLLADVTAALADSGLAPHQLVIEITETVLVTDLPFLAGQLEQLRRLGVRVAIDDFGTGFTSLAHLRQLPADVIKIDRSFVAEMGDDDGSLVRLVTDLGHHLGLEVVAEGVETEAQLEVLRRLGCDRVQGFLLGRPMPADQLDDWSARHRDRIRVAIGGDPVA